MPFRHFNPRFLPKIIANQFKLSWRPIFVKMLEAAELPTLNEQCLNHQMLDLTFNIASDHLKANICSYVWERYSNFDNWQVIIRSKMIKYTEILQNGTESDISNLPKETSFNKKKNLTHPHQPSCPWPCNSLAQKPLGHIYALLRTHLFLVINSVVIHCYWSIFLFVSILLQLLFDSAYAV